jgi:hypothetical protein
LFLVVKISQLPLCDYRAGVAIESNFAHVSTRIKNRCRIMLQVFTLRTRWIAQPLFPTNREIKGCAQLLAIASCTRRFISPQKDLIQSVWKYSALRNSFNFVLDQPYRMGGIGSARIDDRSTELSISSSISPTRQLHNVGVKKGIGKCFYNNEFGKAYTVSPFTR